MRARITRPAFNPMYRVLTAGEDTLLLLSERDEIILQGRAYAALAPLLDGHTTSDQLVQRVRDAVPPAEAYYALLVMEQKGFLTEADSALPEEEAAYWSTLGIAAHTAAARLQNGKVAVTTYGALDAAPLVDKLRRHSIATVASSEESTFDIVLTDQYLRDELRTFNEQAWAKQRPWLLAKPVGSTIWLGPFFRPAHTACWACLAHRLRFNQTGRDLLAKHQSWTNRLNIPQATTPATLQTAMELIALEAGKLIVQEEQHALQNALLSMDMRSLQTKTHRLVRRPQCPVCGDEAYRSPQVAPIRLQSQRKLASSEGGSRTVTAEETLHTYGHHIDPITGIVRKLEAAETTPAHPLIHNYTADANTVFSQSDDIDALKQHLRSRSAGKGVTPLQAKVGALCESMERYSGVFQGEEPRIQSSYQALGEQAIHPYNHLLFSENQYEHRDSINSKRLSMFQWIPQRFDEQRILDWTPVWSLTEQRQKYLPTSCCYYFYPQSAAEAFALADSNGAASGNTREEAILQGFFELVERDAVAIWWYNRLRREQLDLASFQHPYVRQLQDAYRDHFQRDFWVLNLTHDLGIPTFAAISRQLNRPQEHLILGFGAHFDPEIALLRALTEMNQSLPLLGQGMSASIHPQIANWWQTATLQNQPYLQPDLSRPAVQASDFSFQPQDDLLEDVRLAQRIVEQKGLEMLVLDQTRPDVGLPVVKVIVPGLRHFWTRFAPGRLYEVPVQMNWLSAPLAEADLNPIPMFL